MCNNGEQLKSKSPVQDIFLIAQPQGLCGFCLLISQIFWSINEFLIPLFDRVPQKILVEMCKRKQKNMDVVESFLFFSLILKYDSFPTCMLGDSGIVHPLFVNMQRFITDQTAQKCGELSLHTPVTGINVFC